VCSPPIALATVRSAAWWVPTLDEEEGKRVDREREYLVQERTRIENGC
jgi:hypothetical protein